MMKIKNLLVIALVVSSYFVSAQGITERKYAVKSGIIEYTYSGNQEGSRVEMWDNYGDKIWIDDEYTSTTKIMGITNTEEYHKVTIMDHDKYWITDLNGGDNVKGTITLFYPAKEYAAELTEQEARELEEQTLKSCYGEKLSNETVLGYNCEVFTVLGNAGKSWVYKGITLKNETKVLGIKVGETATTFKPDASVPASKFVPDLSLEYIDMDQYETPFSGNYGDNSYEDNSSETSNSMPGLFVDFDFEKFKQACLKLTNSSYNKISIMQTEVSYAGVFMKGFGNMLTVLASPEQYIDQMEMRINTTSFTHNGSQCWYQKQDEDGQSILLVKVNGYKDLYISLVSSNTMEKDTILGLFDVLSL